jgi:hypothetical protein
MVCSTHLVLPTKVKGSHITSMHLRFNFEDSFSIINFLFLRKFPFLYIFKKILIFLGPHKESDEKKYHAYYQWVPLVLAIQVFCND